MGGIMILAGILFIIFASQITAILFPNVTQDAIMFGAAHRQILGGASIAFGIIFTICREIETESAKRLLFGAGIGFICIILTILKTSIIDGITTLPMPSIVIFGIFAVISFYTSGLDWKPIKK